MAVVQHGILEPKWDEVGVLGKGGIRLVLETELGKNDAHEGRQRPTHNKESKLEQCVRVGLEGGSVATVVIGAWLQMGID